jgi:hypothetical protein
VFGSKSAKKVQKSKSFALSLSLSIGSEQALTFIGRHMDRPWLLKQEGTRLVETRHFNKVRKKGESKDGTRHEVSHESERSQQLELYIG